MFVLALRHIIRQAKKGRCCGCSGCGGCEGCPSRSGCEEGLGRLEHEEDADSGRSAGQSAAGCRSGGATEQKHPEKKGGERNSECSGNGPLSHWSKGTGCSNGFPKSGGRKPEASGRENSFQAAPVRKNADAGGRFRWKMREGLGGSGHD